MPSQFPSDLLENIAGNTTPRRESTVKSAWATLKAELNHGGFATNVGGTEFQVQTWLRNLEAALNSGSSSVTIKNAGGTVGTASTLDFYNAQSVTVTSGTASITLPAGGGGGGSVSSVFGLTGAVNLGGLATFTAVDGADLLVARDVSAGGERAITFANVLASASFLSLGDINGSGFVNGTAYNLVYNSGAFTLTQAAGGGGGGGDSYQALAAGASVTWNVDTGNIAEKTLTANTTITIQNLGQGEVAHLFILQDGTGGRTLTLNSTPVVPIYMMDGDLALNTGPNTGTHLIVTGFAGKITVHGAWHLLQGLGGSSAQVGNWTEGRILGSTVGSGGVLQQMTPYQGVAVDASGVRLGLTGLSGVANADSAWYVPAETSTGSARYRVAISQLVGVVPVGAGTSTFKQKSGVELVFRNLTSPDSTVGIAVSGDGNSVELTAAPGGGGGDVTGAANVGTGQGLVFRDEVAGVLNFKRLLAGSNVTITNGADDVTIASTGGGGGNTYNVTGGLAGLVSFTDTSINGNRTCVSNDQGAATTNRLAFQQALDWTVSNGQALWVPPGKWWIDEPINCTAAGQKFAIIGAGPLSMIMLQAGKDGFRIPCVVGAITPDIWPQSNGAVIKDISFFMTNTSSFAGSYHRCTTDGEQIGNAAIAMEAPSPYDMTTFTPWTPFRMLFDNITIVSDQDPTGTHMCGIYVAGSCYAFHVRRLYLQNKTDYGIVINPGRVVRCTGSSGTRINSTNCPLRSSTNKIRFVAAPGGSLPTGISASTTYAVSGGDSTGFNLTSGSASGGSNFYAIPYEEAAGEHAPDECYFGHITGYCHKYTVHVCNVIVSRFENISCYDNSGFVMTGWRTANRQSAWGNTISTIYAEGPDSGNWNAARDYFRFERCHGLQIGTIYIAPYGSLGSRPTMRFKKTWHTRIGALIARNGITPFTAGNAASLQIVFEDASHDNTINGEGDGQVSVVNAQGYPSNSVRLTQWSDHNASSFANNQPRGINFHWHDGTRLNWVDNGGIARALY